MPKKYLDLKVDDKAITENKEGGWSKRRGRPPGRRTYRIKFNEKPVSRQKEEDLKLEAVSKSIASKRGRGRPKGSKTTNQKKPNAWLELIKKVRSENPGLSYKEAMKKASELKKGGVIPAGKEYHQTPTDRLHEAEPGRDPKVIPAGEKYHQTPTDRLHEAEQGSGLIHSGRKYHQTPTDRLHEAEPGRDPKVIPAGKKYHQTPTDRLHEAEPNGEGIKETIAKVAKKVKPALEHAKPLAGDIAKELAKLGMSEGTRLFKSQMDPKYHGTVDKISEAIMNRVKQGMTGSGVAGAYYKACCDECARDGESCGSGVGGNPAIAAALIGAIAPHAINAIGHIAKRAFKGKDQDGGFLPALLTAARVAARAARAAAMAAKRAAVKKTVSTTKKAVKSAKSKAKEIKKDPEKFIKEKVETKTKREGAEKLPKEVMKEQYEDLSKKYHQNKKHLTEEEQRRAEAADKRLKYQQRQHQLYGKQYSAMDSQHSSYGQHLPTTGAPPPKPSQPTGGIVGDLSIYTRGVAGRGTPGDYSFNELGVRQGQGGSIHSSQISDPPVHNIRSKHNELWWFTPQPGLMGITEVPTNQFFTPYGGDVNLGIWEMANDVDEYINSAPTVEDGITVIAPTTMSINPTALSGMPQTSNLRSTLSAINSESRGRVDLYGMGMADRGFVYGPGMSLSQQARYSFKRGQDGGDITRVGFPGASGAGILPTESVMTGKPLGVSARGRGTNRQQGGQPFMKGSNIASWH